jgi:hypothetical protein
MLPGGDVGAIRCCRDLSDWTPEQSASEQGATNHRQGVCGCQISNRRAGFLAESSLVVAPAARGTTRASRGLQARLWLGTTDAVSTQTRIREGGSVSPLRGGPIDGLMDGWWQRWCGGAVVVVGGAVSGAVEVWRGPRLAARSIAATQPALSDRSRRHQVHYMECSPAVSIPLRADDLAHRFSPHPDRYRGKCPEESGSCRRPRTTHPSRRSPFLCISGGGSDQSCRWCWP